MQTDNLISLKRQRIELQDVVKAVGLYPFVYRFANRLRLSECVLDSLTKIKRALMQARVDYLNPRSIPQNVGVSTAIRRR